MATYEDKESLQDLYGDLDYESCPHTETLEAICVKCGALVSSLLLGNNSSIHYLGEQEGQYVQNHTIDKGILPDLSLYSCFPMGVKIRANEVYKKMNPKTYKQNCRTYMLIHVVCEAYYLLNSPKDPRIIATYFGMDPKAASSAYNKCHYIYSGYKESYSRADAIDYIPHYANRLGLDDRDIVSEIIEESEEIFYAFYEDLEDKTPQSIAIALLLHYCTVHSYASIGIKEGSRASMLSENIVSKHYKIITDLVNQSI